MNKKNGFILHEVGRLDSDFNNIQYPRSNISQRKEQIWYGWPQLRLEQSDELIQLNNEYTPELQEYSLFAQLTKPLYETAPMDVMLLNHEMEISRMMGTPGVTSMKYVLEESPFSPAW
ncbi:unnamed protein product (macronuclear) [Paramecium tetraurelia]|uniref:Uncharacterized protein n=1 Tax=Paramecium tetraurelia TaxID=5888 RepID=A0DV28_PARTE|nr:uncharacterized protein GSPATT00020557001 [Paramecium tetraurelia]CAK86895.1 unnamed protein product [Paramecium tetraurelia]|eukprot:XP_001454292.1 hypothetical protein (macronuclear) [Paramecium tetraurelia strain d4-2]